VNLCNPTVFVVEVDPVARNSMVALVSSMSLDCRSFSSAEQFLDHIDPSQPGCVITDFHLEGMNGLQLQEHLTHHDYAMPFVLVSECIDVPLAVRAMQNGAVTVLEKPCQTEQLSGAIQEAVSRSREVRATHVKLKDLRARIDGLEPREREVMMLIVNGMPNKTIARELGISMRTTARIRADIFKKMGAESAVDLADMTAELRRLQSGDCL
jgi:two-component system, LuxR family, response regulator FixJ